MHDGKDRGRTTGRGAGEAGPVAGADPAARRQAAGFQRELRRLRDLTHGRCVVCGGESRQGLHVAFEALPDGSVQGRLPGRTELAGYPETLHGGIIASLLDGAMTNCLFAHGIVAVTAELTVRYRRPVSTLEPVEVRAWRADAPHGLHRMEAELRQGGEVLVSAKAKFLSRQ